MTQAPAPAAVSQQTHARARRGRGAEPIVPSGVLDLDFVLCQLAAARDRLVVPLARAARLFWDARGWTPFGFSQPDDWARERLGRSASWLRRLANIDRALAAHPALAAALTGADGQRPIGTAALLEIAGVGHVPPPWAPAGQRQTPRDGHTESRHVNLQAWIALARTLPIGELRRLVRAARDTGVVAADPDTADSGIGETRGVRLEAPPDVLLAFEHTLELHRAVVGRDTGAASFVEALCAEAASGSFAFDTPPLQRAASHAPQAVLAGPHFGSTSRRVAWNSSAMRRAAATLRRFARLEHDLETCIQTPAGPSRLQRLAGLLADLVALENTLEIRLGELLVELGRFFPRRSGLQRALQCTSVAHYAEDRLRMSRTTARDRMDAARGLRRLPVIESAYEDGRIGLEKVLLILRLSRLAPMDAHTQEEWVQRAGHATLKRCRDEYRSLRNTHALWRSDPAGPRPAPQPLDDDAWLASVRRTPGRTRAFVLDVGCRVLERQHAGRWSPVVCMPLRLPLDTAHSFIASLDAARRVLTRDAQCPERLTPAAEARLRPTQRIARLFAANPDGVPAWLGLLALLEDYVMTWDDPEAMPDRQRHTVHERDGYRCMGPACTQRQTLEAHHLRYRAHGGGNAHSNLLTLCAFHHRLGEHGQYAACTGTAPLDVVWGLGCTDLRLWYRNEMQLERAG